MFTRGAKAEPEHWKVISHRRPLRISEAINIYGSSENGGSEIYEVHSYMRNDILDTESHQSENKYHGSIATEAHSFGPQTSSFSEA